LGLISSLEGAADANATSENDSSYVKGCCKKKKTGKNREMMLFCQKVAAQIAVKK